MPESTSGQGTRPSLLGMGRLSFVYLLAVVYLTLWFLTSLIGTRAVRTEVFGRLQLPPPNKDLSKIGGSTPPAVTWGIQTRAYGPFVIVADYSWSAGPLYGGGGKTVYLWVLGFERLRTFSPS